ncbi:MAG: hypothetical protein A3I88_01965 [Candidatus Portnoybacteria bacterium RIFCSPLOWO2_12_FULL_39_9]|uniref:Uncharacterized protein n=1 Tax=Candidatus Portnoybacteria bacterium RIFCSPHIGHO2_12_FULL_38_9 TaxID=1801997 RepID=A0A1G2FEV1_9BACT|nr:MAG: hypothetical protein A3H00_00510 [Candidatus Portnoybacteria bacterium RBG_13_40_8]OGZ36170.1 MAG: hypothetical protein A3J64_00185 [Candidatus Portnoybacteria bacterium RIFCSPHIGHO2_12_FULL_38_9]OGZ37196.1 MAG: hypothetical protein A2646_03355 [Candidatus Portnoybacteria bacterium RIFCSPHIGHO2_02_FULL_39_12]OGZ38576.1 MAG: hypothetical protein A3F21_01105 [Candidatus Portnoybacteria bacterium RIFCSPLOWO2_01_FULL_38_39]OGZ41216.1 MAG: hypothetical protein A3I88_01965 [Candidatus Portnoy
MEKKARIRKSSFGPYFSLDSDGKTLRLKGEIIRNVWGEGDRIPTQEELDEFIVRQYVCPGFTGEVRLVVPIEED